jgi:hypothetical protein
MFLVFCCIFLLHGAGEAYIDSTDGDLLAVVCAVGLQSACHAAFGTLLRHSGITLFIWALSCTQGGVVFAWGDVLWHRPAAAGLCFFFSDL